MKSYTYQKLINSCKLYKEISSSQMVNKNPVSISYEDSECTITFGVVLSASDESLLNNIVENHDPVDTDAYLITKIENAMEYGRKIMIMFSAENVGMGITQAGKTKAVLDYLIDVKLAVETGSLYTAIDEIDELILAGIPQDLSPFITQERLESFKFKIETYLNG